MKLKVPYSKSIVQTMQEFSKATQYAYDFARDNKIRSWKILHQRTYANIRNFSKLGSQLCCKSIKTALETKRGCKNRKADFSKELAIQYDQRSYSFDFSGKCSLSTIDGRVKFIINIPEYYLRTYSDWSITSATLCRIGKELYLNVVVAKDINPSISDLNPQIIGIDVGINNLAATSNKQIFKGVKRHIAKIQRLRSILQSKGTKSSKRHLKRLRGRQTRFMKAENHRISAQIVRSVNAGDIIIMEDLRGIRKGNRGKELNRLLSNWAFNQFKNFVEYKVVRKGGIFATIPAHYSSKTCSRCHELHTVRPNNAGFFRCLNCRYSCNSDLNASFNLRNRANAWRNALRAAVSQPIVGFYSDSDKPTNLFVGS